MKKLMAYEEGQTHQFFQLNSYFMSALQEETIFLTENDYVALPPQYHRVWRLRKANLLAQSDRVQRNLTWVVQKIVDLEQLAAYGSNRPNELEAMLKGDDVKARVGNV
jgi:hypothetical protein